MLQRRADEKRSFGNANVQIGKSRKTYRKNVGRVRRVWHCVAFCHVAAADLQVAANHTDTVDQGTQLYVNLKPELRNATLVDRVVSIPFTAKDIHTEDVVIQKTREQIDSLKSPLIFRRCQKATLQNKTRFEPIASLAHISCFRNLA